MAKKLLATQKDCWVVAYKTIDPTKCDEHRLATAAYAVSTGCDMVGSEDNRIVAREDLLFANASIPETGLSMLIECGFESKTVTGVDWSYMELWLRNPEVKGSTERDASTEVVLKKVSGDNVGDVSIKHYASSFLHNIVVKTPINFNDTLRAWYKIENGKGKKLHDFEIRLEPEIEDFPIALYIDTTNETSVAGEIVLGDMYAGTKYDVDPNSHVEYDPLIIRSTDLWYKSGGEMGQPISFMCNDKSLHWEINQPDTYSYLDPDPDNQSGHVPSRLKFIDRQAAANLYQIYLNEGEASIWIDVYLVNN